jgi:hypothetical protein
MTADEALAQHRAFLAEIGEDIVVRRYSGTGPTRTATDVTTRARVTGYQPRELVGAIVQGDRKVIALADNVAALLPLTTTDKLVIRGHEVAIKAVDDNTRRISGVLIALEIQAAG